MNRVEKLLNDIELAAKKLEISVEDAVAILLGTSSTHKVVQTHVAVENPTVSGATPNSPTPSISTISAATPTPVAPSAETVVSNSANPTSSGPADASAGAESQAGAGIIESGSSGEAATEAQNKAAAGAQIED